MPNNREIPESNFFYWFLSGSEKKEKLISFFVLFIEVILLTFHAVRENTFLICCTINLIFLLYFLYDISFHFNEEYLVDNIGGVAAAMPQFKGRRLTKAELMISAIRANESVRQLKSFRGFLASTVFIYLIIILDYTAVFKSPLNSALYSYFLNLAINFVSYVGVLYVLKCFYVLYYPSFDNQLRSTIESLNRYYWVIIASVIAFEAIIGFPADGIVDMPTAFVFQFLCSTISSFTFILLFARFENRLLGIPPVIIIILYIYAIIQNSLPMVVGSISNLPKENDLAVFFKDFKSYLLIFALIGKLFLYNIFVYLYRTKRIYYYLLMIKVMYDVENQNWEAFDKATVLDDDINKDL